MEPILAVSIYVRSSIKFLYFVPFRSTNKYCRQGQFLILIGYCLKKSSPLKLLGKMEPNLAGRCKILYKASSFGSIRPTNMATKINSFFFDWLMLKKSSPLKQLGQMEPNLAGSIYVRCPNLA